MIHFNHVRQNFTADFMTRKKIYLRKHFVLGESSNERRLSVNRNTLIQGLKLLLILHQNLVNMSQIWLKPAEKQNTIMH